MNFFRKTIFFSGCLIDLGCLRFVVSQYVLGMDPCVLCILQRLSVLAVGLVALTAAFFRQASKIGRLFSALLVSVPAVYGAGVAAYQCGCKACRRAVRRPAVRRGLSV